MEQHCGATGPNRILTSCQILCSALVVAMDVSGFSFPGQDVHSFCSSPCAQQACSNEAGELTQRKAATSSEAQHP